MATSAMGTKLHAFNHNKSLSTLKTRRNVSESWRSSTKAWRRFRSWLLSKVLWNQPQLKERVRMGLFRKPSWMKTASWVLSLTNSSPSKRILASILPWTLTRVTERKEREINITRRTNICSSSKRFRWTRTLMRKLCFFKSRKSASLKSHAQTSIPLW